jgi:membrane dipeptidase
MEDVANHIDHVCQLTGTTKHSGIGSDLDGGFGTEQTPRDLKSINDLHLLEDILERRGYSAADIDAIFWMNFVTLVAKSLPE